MIIYLAISKIIDIFVKGFFLTKNLLMLDQLRDLLKHKKSKQYYAEKLEISIEEVEELMKELKEEEKITGDISIFGNPSTTLTYATATTNVNNDKGTLTSEIETSFEPKSDLELAELHKIDLTKYKISSYWSKQKPNGNFNSSVNCTLKKIDVDLVAQKNLLLEELKNLSITPLYNLSVGDKKYAYEINIPDVHFGKMAWKEESGEDYDLKIAEERYTKAIEELLSLVNLNNLEKILFPIGNDMINIDSRRNETFAGTRQDSDSRFFKILKTVKSILIKSIDSLSLIAPVEVIVVSGNHDPESMFMIGEILDAYYHNNSNVIVNNSAKLRKYGKYGKCGFQYTHGNEENHKDLGLIFATEETQLWADTEFRFCKIGHFHKNKTISYVSVDEYQGFQIQTLPSLSGSDAWHYSKGYMSKKQAKGFLYHKEKGQVAEYTYNV